MARPINEDAHCRDCSRARRPFCRILFDRVPILAGHRRGGPSDPRQQYTLSLVAIVAEESSPWGARPPTNCAVIGFRERVFVVQQRHWKPPSIIRQTDAPVSAGPGSDSVGRCVITRFRRINNR